MLQQLTHRLGSVSREHLLNFGSTIVARVVALGAFAASAAYFVSHGGASDYGAAALFLTVLSFLQLTDLGIGYATHLMVTKALTQNPAEVSNIVVTAGPLCLVWGTIATLVLVAAAPLLSQLVFASASYSMAMRYLCSALLFTMVSAYFTAIVQAHNKLYWINGSRLLNDVAKALALVVAAGRSLETFTILLAVAAAVKMLVDGYMATRLIAARELFSWRPRMERVRSILSVGVPMFVSTGIGVLAISFDKVFVSRIFGTEQFAYYSIASDLASKASFVAFALINSLYTIQVRRHAAGQKTRDIVVASLLSIGVLTVCYYAPLAVFAEEVLRIWLGAQFAEHATRVVQCGCLMGVVYLLMNVAYTTLQARGRPYQLMFGWSLALAVVVGGLSTMPRSWGIEGAMLIVAASFLIQGCYYIVAVTGMRPAAEKLAG